MQDLYLYIHYPFCLSKCFYCDFNSHIRDKNILDKELLQSYLDEIDYFYDRYLFIQGKNIKTIYFGGGTPALMDLDLCDKILNHIMSKFKIDANIEITLEANPTIFEINKFKSFKSLNINRISLGVQSFNDKRLKFLGRNHDSKNAIYAIENIAKIFDNYSFDIIYAFYDQTKEELLSDLNKALDLAGNHLSIYSLIIEKATKFYSDFLKGKLKEIDNDKSYYFYDLVNNIMAKYDFENYEISNYAKNKIYSIHNMAYFKYLPYLGIGPGAHSRIYDNDNKLNAISNIYDPKKWIKSKNKILNYEILAENDIIKEFFMMNFRLNQKITNKLIMSKFNKNIIDIFDINKLANLEKENLIDYNNNYVKFNYKARLILNSILNYLFN